jgi:hypothetical protein
MKRSLDEEGKRPPELAAASDIPRPANGEAGATFSEVAARLRAVTRGRRHTPAEILLRESRDQR